VSPQASTGSENETSTLIGGHRLRSRKRTPSYQT
jgi:hypothetical protein